MRVGQESVEKLLEKDGNVKTVDMKKKTMKNPCWKGYTAYGTKKKGGKTVPNCVPKKKSTKK